MFSFQGFQLPQHSDRANFQISNPFMEVCLIDNYVKIKQCKQNNFFREPDSLPVELVPLEFFLRHPVWGC